jgi:hypothetical protein
MFSTNTAANVPIEMPELEKVKYSEFQPLVKIDSPQAITFVNKLLLQENQSEEDKKRIKEEAHVAEMIKKYGYGWENQVDDSDEDCPTAYNLRLEWEREDEYQRIAAAEAYEQHIDK